MYSRFYCVRDPLILKNKRKTSKPADLISTFEDIYRGCSRADFIYNAMKFKKFIIFVN